jgi:quinoprotein dehydrogenase-associated probable ABC transporter substrate-binding protein
MSGIAASGRFQARDFGHPAGDARRRTADAGRRFRYYPGLTAWLLIALTFSIPANLTAAGRELRVCADPNNLPFSNRRGEGFENRIAEVIARELKASIGYTWWAQRRGFVRNTLREGLCDVVVGVPAGYDPVLTTRPYYRSSYVFVSRSGRGLHIDSFDDPRLRKLRIGVHLMGDDGANAPPGHALARRGIIDNVAGFTIYGDYTEPNPPARLIDAVASGNIDLAVAWGPLAGYFAPRAATPLDIVPVAAAEDPPGLRFVFAIAMGVRREEKAFRDELDALLESRREEIGGILQRYGVPVLAGAGR